MTAPTLTPDQEAELLAAARAALRGPVAGAASSFLAPEPLPADDLAAIDALWPTSPVPAAADVPPALPAVTRPPPLPVLEPLAAELVAVHRERLALAAAVLAAQEALGAALVREERLRPRVEAAMAFARQDRVVVDGGVISLVSARVRRGDPEGTVIGRSGLRVRLRSPRADDEPLFARGPQADG